jgi:adenine-specific DNA-methyltransferase
MSLSLKTLEDTTHFEVHNERTLFHTTILPSLGRLNTFGFFIERGIRILSEGGMLGYIIPNTILTQEYYFQLREFILNSTRIKEIVSYKQIEQNIFVNNYKKQFSVSNDATLQKLKLKIGSSTTLTFKNIGEINQAIALKSDRSAFLYDKKLGKNYKPVLDGREINRYQINWSGKYLKYEISAIHSCKREDIFLSDEKILALLPIEWVILGRKSFKIA